MDMDYYVLKTHQLTNCLNATNIPCWVPQMADIVEYETQNNLDKCSTLMDYNCEKQVLFHSMVEMGYKCPKPCEKLHYKLIEREGNQIPMEHFDWVSISLYIETKECEIFEMDKCVCK